MTNKSTKSEEFYSRFEKQLKESQDWPGSYLFKFIVKDVEGEVSKLKKILKNYDGDISQKSSSNNKFISLSFKYFASNPSKIIKIYKEVSSIDSIISL